MAKPTPGPWKAGQRTVTAPETEERLPLDVRIYGGNADDNRANARLIAAAPTLLKAARVAVIALAHITQSSPQDEAFYGPAYRALDEAIAAATGENRHE